MEEDNIINKGRPVCISYAHDKDREEWKNVSDIVWNKDNGIVSLLQKNNIEYKIDKIDLHDNLSDFEREVSFGECIIIVFSDKYLKQPHTMYELSRIMESKMEWNHDKKICCISVDDTIKSINKIKEFWENERDKHETPTTEVQKAVVRNDFFLNDIKYLESFYNDDLRFKDRYKLVEEIKYFFTHTAPKSITNPFENFYKFDKDMWKNLVLSFLNNGQRVYFIPDITEGLKNEDRELFAKMITRLQQGGKETVLDQVRLEKQLDEEEVFSSKAYAVHIKRHSGVSTVMYYYKLSYNAETEYRQNTEHLEDFFDAYAAVFNKAFGGGVVISRRDIVQH